MPKKEACLFEATSGNFLGNMKGKRSGLCVDRWSLSNS